MVWTDWIEVMVAELVRVDRVSFKMELTEFASGAMDRGDIGCNGQG